MLAVPGCERKRSHLRGRIRPMAYASSPRATRRPWLADDSLANVAASAGNTAFIHVERNRISICTFSYRTTASLRSSRTPWEGPMQQVINALRHLGNVLRKRDRDIIREPPPARWVDLIHHLNEQERLREEEETAKRQKESTVKRSPRQS